MYSPPVLTTCSHLSTQFVDARFAKNRWIWTRRSCLASFQGLCHCRRLRPSFHWTACGKGDNRSAQDPENTVDAEESPNRAPGEPL